MENSRFKFRAWDNENNKYIYDAEYTYDNPHGDCFSDLIDGTYGSFTVEQCTGLKDKNGKLIYEGDIVKTHLKRKGEVFWNEICWCYKTLDNTGCTYIMESYDIEVIGNIHEIEDLL